MLGKEKFKILIVDDERFYINVLNELLVDEYIIAVAKSGEQALLRANDDSKPDLILLDIIMPDMDGYEVCQHLKANSKTRDIPIIFLTAKDDMDDEITGLSLGAVDYITKPMSRPIVRARVATHLALADAKRKLSNQNDNLERAVDERTQEISAARDVAVYCLGALAEINDNVTPFHLKRTQLYVREIANKLREDEKYKNTLTDSYIKLLYKTCPLHDIGKVGVPDEILLNQGPLDEKQRKVMQSHTELGKLGIERAERELGSSQFLEVAKDIVYTHHEHWDGSGYPQGLRKQQIPLAGRIMAVADVYDALIVKRPYKEPISHQAATAVIQASSGSHFDPDVVDAFMRVEHEISQIVMNN